MDYYQYTIQVTPKEPWTEILMMELLELGFESFQDSEKGIDAYVSVDDDPKTSEFFIHDFAIKNSISLVFDKILIPATNWNQEWESSFEVIKVDNFCAIRAPFHAPVLDCLHEIVITPKMSFGTGHHPTTFLMVKAMQDIDFINSTVLDMGSGTGVLGILAAKLGASEITAIDIEDWAVENAIENANDNKVKMEVLLGGKEKIPKKIFNIVFANINRNILSDQMANYSSVLEKNGKLLLSGFLEEDAELIVKCATELNFKLTKKLQKEYWICLVLDKV